MGEDGSFSAGDGRSRNVSEEAFFSKPSRLEGREEVLITLGLKDDMVRLRGALSVSTAHG